VDLDLDAKAEADPEADGDLPCEPDFELVFDVDCELDLEVVEVLHVDPIEIPESHGDLADGDLPEPDLLDSAAAAVLVDLAAALAAALVFEPDLHLAAVRPLDPAVPHV